jgi:peptidyl-prolyl cis-trans isomerase C
MKQTIFFILFVLSSISTESIAVDTAKLDNDTISTVNGKPIKKIWVDTILEEYKKANLTPDPRIIYKQLEDNELLVQESERLGIDKKIDYKAQIELQTRRLLTSILTKELEAKNKISEDTLKKEYEDYKLAVGDKEYSLRHIQMNSEPEAQAVIVELSKGGDFAKIAKDRSKDLKTKDNGGSLGWVKKNDITPEIGNMLPKLQKGIFNSVPIKTRQGWHIILIDDVRPANYLTFDQIKGALKNKINKKEIQKYIETLRSKAIILRNTEYSK